MVLLRFDDFIQFGALIPVRSVLHVFVRFVQTLHLLRSFRLLIQLLFDLADAVRALLPHVLRHSFHPHRICVPLLLFPICAVFMKDLTIPLLRFTMIPNNGGMSMKRFDVAGAVIISDDESKVLCALRSSSMSMAGLWEFPGGKIEPGESPEQCLVREISEELDCVIRVGELIADVRHAYPNAEIRLRTYRAAIAEGTPNPREHERLLWLPIAELKQLTWAPADLPTVEALERS